VTTRDGSVWSILKYALEVVLERVTEFAILRPVPFGQLEHKR
jgi:hypothetical protein